MRVELIYALQNEQKSFFLDFKSGLTVRDVILNSKILDLYPEIGCLENIKVGIYSRVVSLDTKVVNNDRIEIYRQLKIDPKRARSLRAAKTRKNT